MTDQDLRDITNAVALVRRDLELRLGTETDPQNHLTEAARHLHTASLCLRLAWEHLMTHAAVPCPPPNPESPPWRPWYQIVNGPVAGDTQ